MDQMQQIFYKEKTNEVKLHCKIKKAEEKAVEGLKQILLIPPSAWIF